MSFLALMLLAGLAGPGGAADEDATPLPWRASGRLGFTVDAAAFPDSSGSALEVYVRLPPATIASLGRSDQGESRLKVSVALRNRFGAFHHQASQEFVVVPGDTGGFGKVVMLRFPVRSGEYQMDVKLEDLLSRKRGIAYIGRAVARDASLEGRITVPEESQGRRLSDLEFGWSEAGERAAFRRGTAGGGLLPNPDRLYGLLASEALVQFAAVAQGDPREWHWRARLLSDSGRVVAQRESTAAAAPRMEAEIAFDVSTVAAGGYELEVQVWREGELSPLVRRGRMSVAWQRSSWWRNPRDVEDDVHFLLDKEEEEEAFARMSAGEQEAHLEAFWRERDPTPSTAENEARTEFFKRVEHANQSWSRSGLEKGMFTDMGRVFIRHGEPDETLRQVIPAGDQTLLHLLEQIEATEDRPTGDVDVKGLGGDMRPFEVWVYTSERGRGITAKPDPAAGRTRKRLLFLFVDERGYGDYRLRYSTE